HVPAMIVKPCACGQELYAVLDIRAMSAMGQQRSSNDVCATSVITPIAARKRTFRDFPDVPNSEVAGWSESARNCFERASVSSLWSSLVSVSAIQVLSDIRGNPTRVVGRRAHSPFPHRADQIDLPSEPQAGRAEVPPF